MTLFAALLAVLRAASADVSADLADIAARVDYGFYSEERAVIEAAAITLEQMSSEDAMTAYYRGFAGLRLAQLGARQGSAIDGPLDTCLDAGEEAADRDPHLAEAWVLIAACSALGAQEEPLKRVLHQRRRDQALELARQADAANPRILLVEAWSLSDWPPEDPEVGAEVGMKLEEVIGAFRQWPGRYEAPDWGEAEALANLGAVYLQQGDARLARDLIEEALLLAPDYAFALRLMRSLRAAP